MQSFEILFYKRCKGSGRLGDKCGWPSLERAAHAVPTGLVFSSGCVSVLQVQILCFRSTLSAHKLAQVVTKARSPVMALLKQAFSYVAFSRLAPCLSASLHTSAAVKVSGPCGAA